MNTILIVLALWAVHTFGDYVMQTDEDAKNKSSSLKALLSHTLDYSLLWFIVILLSGGSALLAFEFWLITFVAHTAQDYVTSRWAKIFFSKGDAHHGFSVIGMDQLLHLTQILLTYYFLFGKI